MGLKIDLKRKVLVVSQTMVPKHSSGDIHDHGVPTILFFKHDLWRLNGVELFILPGIENYVYIK